MKGQIRYASNGDRTYFLEGEEVSKAEYDKLCAWEDGLKLDEMLWESKAPHGISDCTFMKDSANGRQFSGQPKMGNYYRHIAESMGGSTTGKKYISGLAAFPGDPEAWVDSRGDVERVLAKRGWGSEGTINVQAREAEDEPAPRHEMAPDLVDKYAREIAARDPNPHLVDMEDLKSQVKERMAPKRKKAAKTKLKV